MPGIAISSWPSRTSLPVSIRRRWAVPGIQASPGSPAAPSPPVTVRPRFRDNRPRAVCGRYGPGRCASRLRPRPRPAGRPARRRADRAAGRRLGRPARRLARARRQPARRAGDRAGAGLAHLLAGPGSRRHPAALRLVGIGQPRVGGLEWPRPAVFERFGLRSFGFADRLVLPLRLRPRDASAPVDLALAVFFGVCDDICMPASAELAGRIAPDTPEEGRARIEAALADRPRSAGEAGVAAVACGLAPAANGYELTARVTFAADPAPGQLAVIEPGQPDLWIGEAESDTEGRTLTARAPVEAAGAGGPVLERRSLRLTLLDADRAVDLRGCQGGRDLR